MICLVSTIHDLTSSQKSVTPPTLGGFTANLREADVLYISGTENIMIDDRVIRSRGQPWHGIDSANYSHHNRVGRESHTHSSASPERGRQEYTTQHDNPTALSKPHNQTAKIQRSIVLHWPFPRWTSPLTPRATSTVQAPHCLTQPSAKALSKTCSVCKSTRNPMNPLRNLWNTLLAGWVDVKPFQWSE